MTEEYTKIYCKEMSKSLEDKLFFMKEVDINNYSVIVDFGCSDCQIIEALDKQLTNCNTRLIGIDNNIYALQQGLERIGKSNHPITLCPHIDNNMYNNLRLYDNVLVIFSSVLHECGWYNEDVQTLINIASTVVIRDMKAPMIKGPIDSITRTRITKNFPKDLLEKFEKAYGRIDDTVNLYRYFLMHNWTENWDNELKEDYFSIPWNDIRDDMTNRNFHIVYEKNYILPYIKKEIAAKFQHKIKQATHKQIIFDKN